MNLRACVVVCCVVSLSAWADDEKDCQNEFRITNARCPEMLAGLSCRETREKVGEAYQRCGDEWEARKARNAAAAAEPAAPASERASTGASSSSGEPKPSGSLKAGQGVGRRKCTASSGGVDIEVTSGRTVGVATCKSAIEAEYQKRLCAGKKGQRLAYTWQFADTTGNDDLRCR
ncbi:MAG: hypothetical protein ACOZQL_41980 [Myxococcota bacterium]